MLWTFSWRKCAFKSSDTCLAVIFALNFWFTFLLFLPLSISLIAPHTPPFPFLLSAVGVVQCHLPLVRENLTPASTVNNQLIRSSGQYAPARVCAYTGAHTHTYARSSFFSQSSNRPSAFRQPTASHRSPTFTYDYICLIFYREDVAVNMSASQIVSFFFFFILLTIRWALNALLFTDYCSYFMPDFFIWIISSN